MLSVVEDIIKFRFLMNMEPLGQEISIEKFRDILASWPRATTYNYMNATVWRSPWMGKMKWVAMYHLDNEKYYQLN